MNSRGRAILEGLLADDSVAAVHALGRRAPGLSHPKLTPHVVDFAALSPLPPLDEVYLGLGTTIKAAGSRDAFRQWAVTACSGRAVRANSAPVE